MSEQSWSLLVGFLVIVGFRLLDWVFPKGYFWKSIQKWSVKKEDDDSDETSLRPR